MNVMTSLMSVCGQCENRIQIFFTANETRTFSLLPVTSNEVQVVQGFFSSRFHFVQLLRQICY